jgi:cytochrome P450
MNRLAYNKHRFIGKMTSTFFQSDRKMYQTLLALVEQRCAERDMKAMGQKVPQHSDCIQWIMDTSPKKNPWSAERIVWELMAIWFGACYSLSVTSTFTFHDIGRNPEYLQYLRAELDNHYAEFERTGKGLPLLDSFLKESARLHPVESMSTRRHVMQPYELSNGTKLGVGDWACTPVHAINNDSEYYPSPHKFNGFRFVDPQILEKATADIDTESMQSEPSSLTEVSSKWQFWGTGRMACPGRFYASMVLKIVMGQVLSEYDCTLVEPEAKPLLTWRSTFYPRDGFKVSFTPRE